MIKNTILSGEKVVDSLENYVMPYGGLKQWKDGRSAKEFARFLLSGRGYLPKELGDIIEKYTDCREAKTLPEYVTDFAEFGLGRGEGRNHDALILLDDLVVGVEAKADESLGGKRCGEYKINSENKDRRYNGICKFLYGDGIENHAQMWYQLLSASAGTLLEARKHSVKKALFIVITFLKEGCYKIEKVERNHNALNDFKSSLQRGQNGEYLTSACHDIEFFIEELVIKVD